MRAPPREIDGAKVLWWAWSGGEPFGYCSDAAIHGFAVCRYPNGQLYRFSCNEHWETENDAPCDDEGSAMSSLPLNYMATAAKVQWHQVVD